MALVYRQKTTGERIRPVPGSKEHTRVRESGDWVRVENTSRTAEQPPDPGESTSTDSGQGQVPTTRPDDDGKRIATTRGSAKIKVGGQGK